MSPDLRTRYWISQRSGRACVRVGDEPDTCYDGVAVGHVAFSLDGAHRAFPARLGDGWHVVRDGRPGPRYDGIGELAFSPDGRRLAYAAQRDGSWRVVLDGREGPSFDSLYAGSLLFEPTGRRLAYAGVLHGWAHVVVDGARSEPHEAVSQIRFSSDGSRVGYLARDPPGVRLVVEGRTGPAENAIDTYRFGPGERVAYVALARGVWWVVVGDRRMGPYRSVSGLTLRPDDGEPAFVEADSARERVVLGGRAERWYAEVDPPVFSQGSARWGYVGRDSLESSVVIDGEVVDAWAWAGDLVLGEGRERFVFLGRTEEADFVVDDQGLERFSLVVEGTLQLLPESGRWACLVGELNARTLEVVVEDHDGTLEVSWSDFLEISPGSSAGRVGTAPVRDQLRAWVAAAARLLVGAGGAM